jgi:Ala-tRNA(Pro) deacylase
MPMMLFALRFSFGSKRSCGKHCKGADRKRYGLSIHGHCPPFGICLNSSRLRNHKPINNLLGADATQSRKNLSYIINHMNNSAAFFHLLDTLGIKSHTVEHEAVFTAAEHAGRDVSGWEFPVKNVLLEDKDKQLYLVTMHLQTPPLDLKELLRLVKANGRFSFASSQRLAGALQVLPGSVTPFALFNDHAGKVRFILDDRLRASKTISAHPLTNTMTTTVATEDFLKFLAHTGHKPMWCSLPLKPATP